jgi:recombination protein RecT
MATDITEMKQSTVAVRQEKQPQGVPALLEKMKPELMRALPRHMNADRMTRIALTAFRTTPGLLKCEPRSFIASVVQCATLGLEPNTGTGEAYLIPFGANCTVVVGYQGLIKLAKQTGQVVDIYAMEVREFDHFRCEFGLNRKLIHEPKEGRAGFPAPDKERGEVVGYYAVAVFKDGSRTFVAMSQEDVNAVRDTSQGWQTAKKYNRESKSPWSTNPVQMGTKTVIRRLCKLLPKSPELQGALAIEEARDVGVAASIIADEDGVIVPQLTDQAETGDDAAVADEAA